MTLSFRRKAQKSPRRNYRLRLLPLAVLLALLLPGCGSFSSHETSSPTPSASVTETPQPSLSASPSPEPSEPAATPAPTETYPEVEADYSYDVIVYGGTPSGVMAALAASREKLKVAILEPGRHLGGIITGGLGYSDVGNIKVIGGLAKEFFVWAGIYYDDGGSIVYPIEPHFAEELFSLIVEAARIDVYYEHRLRENDGVQKSGSRIEWIATEDNATFTAKVFIDCSYEGDLMAMSGVSYTVGRESRDTYGESLAGVTPFSITNNFSYDLSAYSAGGLLPGILNAQAAEPGTGDRKLPAYNFRLCITADPDNRVPFARPDHYDSSRYELLLQWLYLLKESEGGRDLKITDVFSLGKLPDGKYDLNSKGPFSSDWVGGSWQYPEAGYDTRDTIIEEHKEYLQGLLYFLANDESVPEELRRDISRWGLAKDEYTDHDNWPYQLYIREARRMVGNFVMTQKDLDMESEKYDSVGMASYNIDSHQVQRVITEDGFVKNEGELQVPVFPYQLPYRILLPKEEEAINLLVPVCVSASHIAYSSIRMEPQFMILGQAAGAAAKLAIVEDCSVQKVDVSALREELNSQGAVLELP
ncbi:FAD-dependent oxidoreductase [Papillibacter cinnamivorans]|uniref:FAD dependent oxidoreductase n=1 Tax=Papillibacter cinnamivorans DSM 12816 TaxID=1122930 RepID=A0A1W2CQG5_9FIRM|nr:FAD-dependent oxidoreductase [Papillibacter cinnamivorans]SMC86868.1 FAD dependent oxidoreductase [Papillibacter cinnamivorans DSM 12816]